MTPTIALALMGSWTYAGFLADEAPPPPPPSPLPSATTTQVVNRPPPLFSHKPSASRATPPPRPESAPLAPARPALFRSTDASGQAWDHADPAFLSRFIEDRNRSLAAPATYSYQPGRSSRCSNGRCN